MPSTITVNIATRRVLQSDPVWARDEGCQISLTNYSGIVSNKDNLRAAVYRSGVLCATCQTWSVTDNVATGTLSTNTAQIVAPFTAITGLRDYENLDFILLVYDASTTAYLFMGAIVIQNQPALLPGTPPDVIPIAAGTTTFGDLKLHNGSLYKQSATDGLWYKWTFGGASDQIHEVLDETGIVL